MAGLKPSTVNGLMLTSHWTVTVTSPPAAASWPVAGKPATRAWTLRGEHQLVAPRSAWAACSASWLACGGRARQRRGPGGVPGRPVEVPLRLHDPAARPDQQQQADQAGGDDHELDRHRPAVARRAAAPGPAAHHPQRILGRGPEAFDGPSGGSGNRQVEAEETGRLNSRAGR